MQVNTTANDEPSITVISKTEHRHPHFTEVRGILQRHNGVNDNRI